MCDTRGLRVTNADRNTMPAADGEASWRGILAAWMHSPTVTGSKIVKACFSCVPQIGFWGLLANEPSISGMNTTYQGNFSTLVPAS